MRKRFLSIVLALCMALTLLPGAALAANQDSVETALQNIYASASTAAEIREAVQNLDRAELTAAIAAADPRTSGGVLETLSNLETNMTAAPSVASELNTASFFPAIAVKAIGAGLNDVRAGEQAGLKIDPPVKYNLPVPEQYSASTAVLFHMNLTGVINTAVLAVPVKIVLPVPAGLDPATAALLRYDANGWLEETIASDCAYRDTATGLYCAAFTLTACGADFAMVEDSKSEFIYIPEFTGGSVVPSVRRASRGETVALQVNTDKDYELDGGVTVTDIHGRTVTVYTTNSGTYRFTMPDCKVTVDAKFVKKADTTAPSATTPAAPAEDEPFTGLGTPGVSGIVLNPAAMPFTDVRSNDWFYDNVDYVWKHYLMSGVSDTQFAPGTTTSRAMIWTVLARMNNIRTDVNPGSTWYERGMLWAVEQGVTDGTDPMGEITREQLATMLWRNAGKITADNTDLTIFSDSGSVSDYALSAVRWAVVNGILNGSNGRLNPQGTATRAEVAAMVARYGDKIASK